MAAGIQMRRTAFFYGLLTGMGLFLAGSSALFAGTNQLKARDAFGMPGQTITIYIDVTNEDAFKGFQFDLTIPAGLTFDGSSAVLTDRKQDHDVASNQVSAGIWRFIGYSLTNAAFLGNSGAILQLTCTATGGVGNYPIIVSGASLSDLANQHTALTAMGGQVTIYTQPAHTRIRARLEGWNQSGYMRTALRSANLLPLSSPYAQAPRSVTSLAATISDWILLELRSTASGPAVYQQSYLLDNEGNLCDLDVAKTDLVLNVPPGNYFLVLRHRNHAAVMSAAAQSLGTTAELYNFITALSKYFQSGGKELPGGYCVLPCGDVNQDTHITSTDYVQWFEKNNASPAQGYYVEDLNGDGLVTTVDFTLWQANARSGCRSMVP
jgi:hypothetical protein